MDFVETPARPAACQVNTKSVFKDPQTASMIHSEAVHQVIKLNGYLTDWHQLKSPNDVDSEIHKDAQFLRVTNE